MKYKLLIEGMSCEHCVKHVKEALEELNGSRNVLVDLQNNSATLEYDGDNPEPIFKEALDENGYDLVSVSLES